MILMYTRNYACTCRGTFFLIKFVEFVFLTAIIATSYARRLITHNISGNMASFQFSHQCNDTIYEADAIKRKTTEIQSYTVFIK